MENFLTLAITSLFLLINFYFAQKIITERLVPAMLDLEDMESK